MRTLPSSHRPSGLSILEAITTLAVSFGLLWMAIPILSVNLGWSKPSEAVVSSAELTKKNQDAQGPRMVPGTVIKSAKAPEIALPPEPLASPASSKLGSEVIPPVFIPEVK